MFRHLVGLVLVGSLAACGSSEPPPAAPGKPINPPTEDKSLEEFMKELPPANPAEPTATAAVVVTAPPSAPATSTPTAAPTTKPTATPTTKPTAKPTAAPTTKPTMAPTTTPKK